jgi:hypothetical protein
LEFNPTRNWITVTDSPNSYRDYNHNKIASHKNEQGLSWHKNQSILRNRTQSRNPSIFANFNPAYISPCPTLVAPDGIGRRAAHCVHDFDWLTSSLDGSLVWSGRASSIHPLSRSSNRFELSNSEYYTL